MYKILIGQRGRYRHAFGGRPRFWGAACRNGCGPLMPILTLDTADPKIGVQDVSDSHTAFPLYYCFRCNCPELTYLLAQDGTIRILHQDESAQEPGFPYEGFPAFWPELPVALQDIPYEHQKTLVFATIACDRFDMALSQADEELVERYDHPFHQLRGFQYLIQPELEGEVCPNPACKRFGTRTEIFCVFQNRLVDGLTLFGDHEDATEQLIFRMCKSCRCVIAYTAVD